MKIVSTGRYIQIKPAKKLSAYELMSEHMTNTKAAGAEDKSLLNDGAKRSESNGTEAEEEELECLRENLEMHLSQRRVESYRGRSIAEWSKLMKGALVLQKQGKFDGYGFTVNGLLYLDVFQTLFLMEVDRLVLKYEQYILSFEKAYSVLLGSSKSRKSEEYRAYSYLTRIGFKVVKHRDISYRNVQDNEECIWAYLENAVQNKPIPDFMLDSNMFETIKKDAEFIQNYIKNQDKCMMASDLKNPQGSTSSRIVPRTLKRRASLDSDAHGAAPRKLRSFYAKNSKGFGSELEYRNYRDYFENFNLIRVYSGTVLNEFDRLEIRPIYNIRKFKIAFDLYLRGQHYTKMQSDPPHMRVIVVHGSQGWPSNVEIQLSYQSQKHRVPIFVLTVNDSKQCNALLYYQNC